MAQKSYNLWGSAMIFVGVIAGLLFAGVMYQWNVGVSAPRQEQPAPLAGGATSAPAAAAVAPPLAAKPDVAPTVAPGSATATTATPLPAGAAQADTASGQRVYQSSCNGCHPNGGQGLGPALRGPAFELKFSKDEDLGNITRQGKGAAMPPFGASQINDQDLTNLIAYIRTLK